MESLNLDLSTLPKVELHCHLLGVISPGLLSRIQSDGGSVLVRPEVLRAAPPVVDVATFRHWVDTLKPYQAATTDSMQPILAAHVASLIAQGVQYAEIMISPTMFPLEASKLIDAVRRWRDMTLELEQDRVQIEFLMSVPRTLADSLLARDLENFLALGRSGLIAGVALVGVESGESIARFVPAFDRWRDVGLGIEIHVGENAGPAAVRDALELGRPDRLGHALSAFDDPRLIDRIRSNHVHLEFCPTSNLRTAAVGDISRHPARLARSLGLRFSLNTDDPGAFDCSMTGEFELAATAWGFGRIDFEAIYRNSLAARFQPALRYLSDADGPATASDGDRSQANRIPTANR